MQHVNICTLFDKLRVDAVLVYEYFLHGPILLFAFRFGYGTVYIALIYSVIRSGLWSRERASQLQSESSGIKSFPYGVHRFL